MNNIMTLKFLSLSSLTLILASLMSCASHNESVRSKIQESSLSKGQSENFYVDLRGEF